MDRRQILGGMSALAATSLAAPLQARRPGRPPIDELDRRDVTLLPGRARAQAARTLETLLAMDEDKLLRPFREAAGMAVGPGKFGGWYDRSPLFDPPNNLTGFIPGHSFGQYVSALSRGYAATGDARAKDKVDRLIAGFAPTVTADFYKGYPLPAYTFDKHVIGLIDAHALTNNAAAMPLLRRATDAVLPWLPGRAIDRRVAERTRVPNMAFGWDETYTLPENLYFAAERGGGERFRRMARSYLLDASYFALLAAGKNDLPGRHAYSHVNALASAAKSYLVDGNPMHLAAARNGMAFVEEQSFATGGWGPSEGFVEPGSGKLGESLAKNGGSFEAPCGTFGHFKVARYLMRITGDSRYGDGMERLFYNAALGVLPLKPDGQAFYYADYSDAGHKTYYHAICPCCSGSIGQLTADYGISAYLRDDAGLYVNLYTPSTAIWRRHGEAVLTLTQRGAYPLVDQVALTVAAPRPVRMTLRLRIPAWAGPGNPIAVNGKPVMFATSGRFASITREWREGDRIDLTINNTLRLEPVDDQHRNRVALMWGPLALFATGKDVPDYTRDQLFDVRRTQGEAEWKVGARAFKPFFAIEGETTRLYQKLI